MRVLPADAGLLPLPRPPSLRYGATPLRQRRGLLSDCIKRRGIFNPHPSPATQEGRVFIIYY
ncbi:MAG: hypothetical protein LBB23_01600 [Rickettsiales bacterium]|nr:hypothetical protein [Rickettsiales bacterium]